MLKPVKKSYHRFRYPSFPAGVTKRIASTFALSVGIKSPRIDKETLDAISEAIDKFFEQLSDDLGVFVNHAKRKSINAHKCKRYDCCDEAVGFSFAWLIVRTL